MGTRSRFWLAFLCGWQSLFLHTSISREMVKGVKRKVADSPAASGAAASSSSIVWEKDPEILEKVQRKLTENFKALTSSECNILTNPTDGLTLRQRIMKDCIAKKKGQARHCKTTTYLNACFWCFCSVCILHVLQARVLALAAIIIPA